MQPAWDPSTAFASLTPLRMTQGGAFVTPLMKTHGGRCLQRLRSGQRGTLPLAAALGLDAVRAWRYGS